MAMDNFHRHVLICEPQSSVEVLDHWRALIEKVAATIMRVNSPQALFEISNGLEHIVANRVLGSGQLGSHVASAVARTESDMLPREGELYSCVCAMLAVREVIAAGNGPKRGVLGVATWSALSFGAPLLEPRLELLRQEILACAQRASLQMATRARQRSEEPKARTPSRSATVLKRELSETIDALRRNAALDQEEITLLRWLLADKSGGLGLEFGDIRRPETAALAMGIELGQILTVFPTVAHYGLLERFVGESPALDLPQFIDAVGGDRPHLVAMCSDYGIMEACPSVFPLMRALAGKPVAGGGARIRRSLTEWWGRALLEGAATVLGGRKGWS